MSLMKLSTEDKLIEIAGHLLQMPLGGFQHLAELVEFAADGAQDLPYLTGPLLDGKGPKAHLEAVEQRRHCSRKW